MNLTEIIKDLAQAIADGDTWYDTYIVADLNDGQLFTTHQIQGLSNAQIIVHKVNPDEDFISYMNPETGNVEPAEVEGFSPELQEMEREYWETAEEEFEHELYEGTGKDLEDALEEAFEQAIKNTPRRVADQLSVLIEYDVDDEEYTAEVLFVEEHTMTIGCADGAIESHYDKGAAGAAIEVASWYDREWMKGTEEYNAIQAEFEKEREYMRQCDEWDRENAEEHMRECTRL